MSRKFLRLRITSKIFNKFNLQTRHFFFVCLFYLSVQSLHIKKDQIPRKCFILFGRGIYRYGDICEELTKFYSLNFPYYEASVRECLPRLHHDISYRDGNLFLTCFLGPGWLYSSCAILPHVQHSQTILANIRTTLYI